MACAAEHGFNVSRPWGDSSRYDFALELDGQFLRVQVKSTTCMSEGSYICNFRPGGRPYTQKQIDFFAVYVIPEDVWYIIPARTGLRIKQNIRLRPHRKNHKHERYREAWELLRAGKPKVKAAAASGQ